MEPFTASDIGILIVSFYIVTVHGVIASEAKQSSSKAMLKYVRPVFVSEIRDLYTNYN